MADQSDDLALTDLSEEKIRTSGGNPWCYICGHRGPVNGRHSCFTQLGAANGDYDLVFLFRAGLEIRQEAFSFFWCQRVFCDGEPIRVNDSFSPQQNKTLKDCQVFQSRCKQIQDWFFPQMRQEFIYGMKHHIARLYFHLFGPAYGSPVAKIEEVQFSTQVLYPPRHTGLLSRHNTYCITLKNGRQYAFDPTGCQFGPDWVLFKPWHNYYNDHIRVGAFRYARPLGSEYLLGEDWQQSLSEE
jgi:hypothetical protein